MKKEAQIPRSRLRDVTLEKRKANGAPEKKATFGTIKRIVVVQQSSSVKTSLNIQGVSSLTVLPKIMKRYQRSFLSIFLVCFLTIKVVYCSGCDTRPQLQLKSGYESYGFSHLRDAVRECQTLLNQKGGYGLEVDGLFGRLTAQAVRLWQERVEIKVDGVVGPLTWRSLCATVPSPNSLTILRLQARVLAEASGYDVVR